MTPPDTIAVHFLRCTIVRYTRVIQNRARSLAARRIACNRLGDARSSTSKTFTPPLESRARNGSGHIRRIAPNGKHTGREDSILTRRSEAPALRGEFGLWASDKFKQSNSLGQKLVFVFSQIVDAGQSIPIEIRLRHTLLPPIDQPRGFRDYFGCSAGAAHGQGFHLLHGFQHLVGRIVDRLGSVSPHDLGAKNAPTPRGRREFTLGCQRAVPFLDRL
jgi:hypothetical protein